VDPFHEGLVAVFPQIRQFLSRLLDPLELEGIDSARPGPRRPSGLPAAAGPGRNVAEHSVRRDTVRPP